MLANVVKILNKARNVINPSTEEKQDTIIATLLLILTALSEEVLLEDGFALFLETGDTMLLE